MPRSYISTEPAVRRAIQNNWDPSAQFIDRVSMLAQCGHVVDKLEVLVLGGTWSSYPLDYRENFIRDIYYTANCELYLPPKERQVYELRPKMSLAEERVQNETAKASIIGLTLETRPDCINKRWSICVFERKLSCIHLELSYRELRHLRNCGCTRVQLGVQHIDDGILSLIKRRCTDKHNKRGIRLLKESGFKVDIHLMPDLPGSSPDIDNLMFETVIRDPDLQVLLNLFLREIPNCC